MLRLPTMNLPNDIAHAVAPLLEALPLDRALEQLVVTRGAAKELIKAVETALDDPALAQQPALAAGLWLYVDELDRSHRISQGLENPTGSFWHGIMHRREGDFSNSHYWFHRVGNHPAIALIPDYDPHVFIDEAAAQRQQLPQKLIERQRREWATLFEWCARNS